MADQEKPEVRTGSAEKRPDQERSEVLDKVIDANLEEIIISEAKVNEGHNGIILRLDQARIPKELTEAIQERHGVELENDQAIKILKVYSKSKIDDSKSLAAHEFEMHQYAYDLATKNANLGEIASVPRPIVTRDISLSEPSQDAMREKGLRNVGDRVEIIMMDFIPGQDLAHTLYKKVTKDHPKAKSYESVGFDPENFEQVKDVAGQVLGFQKAGGRHADESQKQFELRQVERSNHQKVYDFFRKKGHLFNPRIVRQIERTLTLFHRNDFAFRDGHERNFLLVGDEAAIFDQSGEKEVQVFVIDYGSSIRAKYGDHLFEEELSQGVSKKYPHDQAIVGVLKGVTPEKDEKKLETFSKYHENAKWQQWYGKVEGGMKGKSPLESAWGLKPAGSKGFEYFGAAAADLMKKGELTLQDLDDFVGLVTKSELKSHYAEANQLREILTRLK